MRHARWLGLLLLAPVHLSAQVVILDGVASNLGTADAPRAELSAMLRIVTDAAWGDSAVVDIGVPLHGSGTARMACWGDSLRMESVTPEGVRITWLAALSARSAEGEYLVTAGEGAGEGGVWNARVAPSERERLREYCGVRAGPPGIAQFAQQTAAFRQVRLANARYVWEADEQLTAAERIAVSVMQQRVSELFLAELEDRGITELVEQHLAREGVNAVGATEFAARTVASGVLRLPGERRLARFRVQARMMLAMSDVECRRWAALEIGQQALYFLSALDEAEMAEHLSWQVTAMEAGLAKTQPEVEQTEDGQTEALLRMVGNLGEGMGPPLLRAMADYEALPPSARCWVERQLIHGALAEEDDPESVATAYLAWAAGRGL